jgi:hypothetical protein
VSRNISRRQFLAGVSLLPLAGAAPPGALAKALASTSDHYVFFTAGQAATVREATARLIPGPQDDPLEAGHPGAREANVVRYIDTLLGAFRVPAGHPPRIHAGGPFSNRNGARKNDMATFVPLTGVRLKAWRKRIDGLQRGYREGIQLLDRLAPGGNFAAASADEQDQVLMSDEVADFRTVLFTHAIEGTYCIPEYGGNAGLSGWREIKYPGDRQPRGYTAAQVENSDGPDPIVAQGTAARMLAQFAEVAPHVAAHRRRG